MIVSIQKRRVSLPHKILSAFIAFTFVFSLVFPPGYAQLIPASPAGGPQTLLNLPAPGTMVTPSAAFTPALINGITIHPENPLEFGFIVGTGDENLQGKAFEDESTKLIKYFLASLTVPEDEMWVNLSPYEKDQIIPEGFGTTEMGRDLLAQDYILKQLTASLMYPEKELGSEFWKKIYQKAYEEYGTTEIPVNTFNKVWIVPEKAAVYEHGNSAFVVQSRLKVMLESDYAAMQYETKDQRLKTKDLRSDGEKSSVVSLQSSVPSEIIKEIILPAIEQEVNEGKGFANLRQIYHSAILAAWFKQNLRQTLLGQVYVDKTKTKGVDVEDKTVNDKIYAQYLEAFKKGVYNYIKEDYDPATREIIPRKYFSGGTNLKIKNLLETYKKDQSSSPLQKQIIDAFLAGQSSEQQRVDINLLELSQITSVADTRKLNEEPRRHISTPAEIEGAKEDLLNRIKEARRLLEGLSAKVEEGVVPSGVNILKYTALLNALRAASLKEGGGTDAGVVAASLLNITERKNLDFRIRRMLETLNGNANTSKEDKREITAALNSLQESLKKFKAFEDVIFQEASLDEQLKKVSRALNLPEVNVFYALRNAVDKEKLADGLAGILGVTPEGDLRERMAAAGMIYSMGDTYILRPYFLISPRLKKIVSGIPGGVRGQVETTILDSIDVNNFIAGLAWDSRKSEEEIVRFLEGQKRFSPLAARWRSFYAQESAETAPGETVERAKDIAGEFIKSHPTHNGEFVWAARVAPDGKSAVVTTAIQSSSGNNERASRILLLDLSKGAGGVRMLPDRNNGRYHPPLGRIAFFNEGRAVAAWNLSRQSKWDISDLENPRPIGWQEEETWAHAKTSSSPVAAEEQFRKVVGDLASGGELLQKFSPLLQSIKKELIEDYKDSLVDLLLEGIVSFSSIKSLDMDPAIRRLATAQYILPALEDVVQQHPGLTKQRLNMWLRKEEIINNNSLKFEKREISRMASQRLDDIKGWPVSSNREGIDNAAALFVYVEGKENSGLGNESRDRFKRQANNIHVIVSEYLDGSVGFEESQKRLAQARGRTNPTRQDQMDLHAIWLTTRYGHYVNQSDEAVFRDLRVNLEDIALRKENLSVITRGRLSGDALENLIIDATVLWREDAHDWKATRDQAQIQKYTTLFVESLELASKQEQGDVRAIVRNYLNGEGGYRQSHMGLGKILRPKEIKDSWFPPIATSEQWMLDAIWLAAKYDLGAEGFKDLKKNLIDIKLREGKLRDKYDYPLSPEKVKDISRDATALYKRAEVSDDKLRFSRAASSPVQRVEEIKKLLTEIEKELADPGSGDLPQVAVLSDFHGGLNRFIMLLSDVLNEFSGFQGQLDPNRTIEEQLAAQGLSFKDIKGQIILGGDILDRGKHGIKIFYLIKELVEKGEGKVVYVTGNHDFWAFANLLGMHLPWYKGFHFYGDAGAENLIARYRQTNPELFDTPESILWWTERLAEHNADQDAYQKKAFNGKVKEVRVRFIEDYKTHQKNWDDAQKDAMEKFIGYFARIGVADPYVGLNGLGKASASWWKQVAHQLNQGYEARRSLGAQDAELSVWQEAMALTEQLSREVGARLEQTMSEGKWWYRIFESINTHAYRSVEWSAKDWSSHKGWGDFVIGEINEMIDAGLIREEKLTQKNYIQSPTLQALARFYRENFDLYAFTPYADLFSHGGFPVNADGSTTIFYKGVPYTGRNIFHGLDAISNDVKDAAKPLNKIWEALNLVNMWYADMTTELKPNYIKRNIEQIGIETINRGIGVRHHVTGHNPIALGKLAGHSFMSGDGGYTHAFSDFGMSEKYGGQGGWVSMSAAGIRLRGFESETSDALVDNPRTHVWDKETGQIKKTIENPGLEGDVFLNGAEEQLSEELARLEASSPVEGIVIQFIKSLELLNNQLKEEFDQWVLDPSVVRLNTLKDIVKDIKAILRNFEGREKLDQIMLRAINDVFRNRIAIMATPIEWEFEGYGVPAFRERFEAYRKEVENLGRIVAAGELRNVESYWVPGHFVNLEKLPPASSPASFAKLTIDDIQELGGKNVMVRVDFNVPMINGTITDDTRIRASLPLIKKIVVGGGKVILTAHLGRPQERKAEIIAVKKEQGIPTSKAYDLAVEQMQKEATLAPVAKRLKELLAADNIKVYFNPDYRTPGQEEAAAFIANVMKKGEVLLLENVRFNDEEEISVNAESKLKKVKTETDKLRAENEVAQALEAHRRFSEMLFRGMDAFVLDGFGVAHRGHASVVGAAFQDIPRVAGPLLKDEIVALQQIRHNLNLAIMGGSKVSDKIKVLKKVLTMDTVQSVLIGGAMANSFLKAKGYELGGSFGTKADQVDIARELLANPKIVIPVDGVMASRFEDNAEHRVITFGEEDVPAGWMVVDIGPKTRALYARKIASVPADTSIFWNGPMGAYDKLPSFAADGTRQVAEATAVARAFTMVGGGDSVDAVNTFGLSGYGHVSTGGGAALEALELAQGRELAGIAALSPAPVSSPLGEDERDIIDRMVVDSQMPGSLSSVK
ncbi:MAG: phosphoglycerate kinase, partial [Omnitrophica WOR_2 bacterium GWA2_53_43]